MEHHIIFHFDRVQNSTYREKAEDFLRNRLHLDQVDTYHIYRLNAEEYEVIRAYEQEAGKYHSDPGVCQIMFDRESEGRISSVMHFLVSASEITFGEHSLHFIKSEAEEYFFECADCGEEFNFTVQAKQDWR